MSSQTCPWCKFNTYGCDYDNCDFKSLPYEKKAIIERVNEESIKVRDLLKILSERENVKNETVSEEYVRLNDILIGINIMVDRLKVDFGMTDKELGKAFVNIRDKMSFVAKAKLFWKLKRLKAQRKKKK